MTGSNEREERQWDGQAAGIHEFEIGADDGLDEFLERVGEEVADLVNGAGGRPAVVKFELLVKAGELNRPSEPSESDADNRSNQSKSNNRGANNVE